MGSGEGADSSFPPPLSPLGVRSCEKILGRAKAFHPARRDKVVEGAKKTKRLFFASLCALVPLCGMRLFIFSQLLGNRSGSHGIRRVALTLIVELDEFPPRPWRIGARRT